MRRGRRGTASLEFALLTPVLVLMFCGIVDLSECLLFARRLQTAASTIAQMASTDSAQDATLNQITDAQVAQAAAAAYAFFPDWARASSGKGGFAVTLSGTTEVATPAGCTTACSYSARVVWSGYAALGSAKTRACGAIAPTADNAGPDYGHLWQDDIGATSLFIADVAATYTPPFAASFIGPISFIRTAVASPRIGNGTVLVKSKPPVGSVKSC